MAIAAFIYEEASKVMDLKKAADNAPNNYDAKTDYDIAYETFNRAISANAAMTPSFLPLLPGHGDHQGLIQGTSSHEILNCQSGAPRQAHAFPSSRSTGSPPGHAIMPAPHGFVLVPVFVFQNTPALLSSYGVL